MSDLTTAEEAIETVLAMAMPGPWEADGDPWNRIIWSSAENRVCFMAHSNGLDDARDIATSNLVAAAPDLARTVIALHAQLADAQAAMAAVAERCAEVPFTEAFFCLPGSPQDQTLTAVAEAIRALAPASGVETLAKLRARAEKAEAEIERLKDPRTAARLICDEVLQKPSDEAAAMREAMVKATMGTKVPALTGEVRWSVVNDALRALAALARPHATKGEAG